jgi:hypothetical protein
MLFSRKNKMHTVKLTTKTDPCAKERKAVRDAEDRVMAASHAADRTLVGIISKETLAALRDQVERDISGALSAYSAAMDALSAAEATLATA